MSEWTAEPADEHGTPGLWAWHRGLPTLRYIARPDGADDRRVPADAYRLLRRLLTPTVDDVIAVAEQSCRHHPRPCDQCVGRTDITLAGLRAALADETGDE